MRLLRAHCDDGGTAILVTHDAAHAAWADRVVFLRDGRLVDEARPGAEPGRPAGGRTEGRNERCMTGAPVRRSVCRPPRYLAPQAAQRARDRPDRAARRGDGRGHRAVPDDVTDPGPQRHRPDGSS